MKLIIKSCETIEELKILIDDYMDYYNNERCQWNLKKADSCAIQESAFSNFLRTLFSSVLAKGSILLNSSPFYL